MTAGRPRVGVSSCLLGEEVRFNGGHKRYRFLTDELGPYVDWVPYCPEVSDRAGDAARADPANRRRAAGQPGRHGRPHGGDGGPALAARGPGRVRVQGQVAELRHPRHPAVRRGRYRRRSRRARTVRRPGADRVPAAGRGGRGAAERRRAARGVLRADLRRGPARSCFPAVVGEGTWWPSRPAQAAVAGARPGALPVGGPGRGRGRRGPRAEAAYRDLFLAAMASRASLGRTATRCSTPTAGSAGSWTGRGGWTWWPGSRPFGAARSRSACRSRCSRTIHSGGSRAGWRSKPSSGPSPGRCGCGMPFRHPFRREGMKPLVRAT